MHIKRMHEMIERLTDCTKTAIENDKVCVGKYPIADVVDMIKDLNEASYYASVVKAMEEEKREDEEEEKYMLRMLKEEHGMSEEDSRRFYDAWRYKNGRFAPKGRGTRRGYEEPPYYHMNPDDYKAHDAEWYRDMDRKSRNVMYFSEPMGDMARSDMRHEESRYDRARRGYSESKQMHKSNSPEDNSENMRNLEKILNIIAEDVKEYMPNMSPSEKAMAKQKIDGISKSIQ